MRHTPQDAPAAAATTARGRRLGPLPVWAWVLSALVLVLIALGILLVCTSGSPSETVTATATPTATTGPDVGQGTFASEMDSYLGEVLFSQNTAVLSQGGTFSDPVIVVSASGGTPQTLTPDEAVTAMDPMFTPVDPDPWDLALSAATLDGYRAGPFGEYFPAGAIVARSHDGHVFSFIGNDSTITTMLLASSEDLLL